MHNWTVLKQFQIFIKIDIKKLLHDSVWNTIIREHTIWAILMSILMQI